MHYRKGNYEKQHMWGWQTGSQIKNNPVTHKNPEQVKQQISITTKPNFEPYHKAIYIFKSVWENDLNIHQSKYAG